MHRYKRKHPSKIRRKENGRMNTMEILTLLLVIVAFLDYISAQ